MGLVVLLGLFALPAVLGLLVRSWWLIAAMLGAFALWDLIDPPWVPGGSESFGAGVWVALQFVFVSAAATAVAMRRSRGFGPTGVDADRRA